MIPALGQGSWHMAEGRHPRAQEIDALRTGLDLGLSLIDTAEMYARGAAEELVGEAIAGRRDEVFLVSKVMPQNATRAGTIAACAASLRRLGTDRLDLYLLHWRGRVPLAETVAGFEELVRDGPDPLLGGEQLRRRRPARSCRGARGRGGGGRPGALQPDPPGHRVGLLAACAEAGLPIMAYTPVTQGRVLGHPALRRWPPGTGATPAQVALAWVLRVPGVCAIPGSGRRTMSGRTGRRSTSASTRGTSPSSTGPFRRRVARVGSV